MPIVPEVGLLNRLRATPPRNRLRRRRVGTALSAGSSSGSLPLVDSVWASSSADSSSTAGSACQFGVGLLGFGRDLGLGWSSACRLVVGALPAVGRGALVAVLVGASSPTMPRPLSASSTSVPSTSRPRRPCVRPRPGAVSPPWASGASAEVAEARRCRPGRTRICRATRSRRRRRRHRTATDLRRRGKARSR